MAMTRQYRVMTAWIVVTVVWKSWTSALIETFITDWSSTMRNCAVAKATSASQPLFAVASFTFPLLVLRALARNGSSPKESQILGVALRQYLLGSPRGIRPAGDAGSPTRVRACWVTDLRL